MPRAPKRCSQKCSNVVFRYGRCSEHQPERVPWQKTEESPDRSYLKSADWQRQRRRVLFEDNNYNGGCQLKWDGCTGFATEVDHILPVWYSQADKVDDDELQGLCKSCHGKKSSLDGYFAKQRKKNTREN